MKKIIIGAIGLILAVIIGILIWYNVSLSPVSSKKVEENEVIRVEIEKGLGNNQIAKVLEKNDIIRSATYKTYVPLFTVALIYLVMVIFFTNLVSRLERRLRSSER